jgi:hypothetical protein
MRKVGARLESTIQTEISQFLRDRGWTVLNMHGNQYQKGVPDSYCWHKKFRQRWVEVKRPDSYKFTKDQLKVFPTIEGSGIWIMQSIDQYQCLFGAPNWREFLHPRDIKFMEKFHGTSACFS